MFGVSAMVVARVDCSTGCRHVSRDEVDEVLASGSINDRKSDTSLRPCPKYVVDGSPGGRNVQVSLMLIDAGHVSCGRRTTRHNIDHPATIVQLLNSRDHIHASTLQCVVSACPQATTLVTVIDLDKDWSATCYCP